MEALGEKSCQATAGGGRARRKLLLLLLLLLPLHAWRAGASAGAAAGAAGIGLCEVERGVCVWEWVAGWGRRSRRRISDCWVGFGHSRRLFCPPCPGRPVHAKWMGGTGVRACAAGGGCGVVVVLCVGVGGCGVAKEQRRKVRMHRLSFPKLPTLFPHQPHHHRAHHPHTLDDKDMRLARCRSVPSRSSFSLFPPLLPTPHRQIAHAPTSPNP